MIFLVKIEETKEEQKKYIEDFFGYHQRFLR